MAIEKQTLNINFSEGLDTKTDPKQVSLGKFLALENSVFTTGKRLTKRNGFGALTSLPEGTPQALTTFNSNLVVLGDTLESYSSAYDGWLDQGSLTQLSLSTVPLVRNNYSQTQVDCVVAPNGLACSIFISNSTNAYYYSIIDTHTSQSIVGPTPLFSAVSGLGARVFVTASCFIFVYSYLDSPNYHLRYAVINFNQPTQVVSLDQAFINSYATNARVSFDGVVLNGSLYVACRGDSNSGVKMAYIDSSLRVSSTVTQDSTSARSPKLVGCFSDPSGCVWVSYFGDNNNVYAFCCDQRLNILTAPTLVMTIGSNSVYNMTGSSMNEVATVLVEISNPYSFSSTPTNYIKKNTINNSAVIGTPAIVIRSVGLASKSFYYNDSLYVLCTYQSNFQSTYFLINASGTVSSINSVGKLAYSNGGGYYAHGLPNVSNIGATYYIAYLIKDFIEPLNKSEDQTTGIYSQLGVNLASFSFGNIPNTAEIGSNLNISGAQTNSYDGMLPTEQGFHLWPDEIKATWSTSGGSVDAKPDSTTNTDAYAYQVIYQWTDHQGNIFQSAPSIPCFVTTTGSGTTGSISLDISTLRITNKTNVRILIFRWSIAQQVYYQISPSTFTANNSSVDSITFVDTQADSSILGNSILYTTGGVLENISPPAFDATFIFDDRLWGIDSEDKNLLWFSKQVIEGTPVEMSDFLTFYVAPNIGAQGSTGPLRAGSSMDDKLILFKDSAINYIAGSGPDNTGTNNQYTQPIFITSVVGCSNPKSIVFQPNGLMFEFSSPAGNQIWLLGRDLSTRYIGAEVEALTQNATVLSSINIPGNNQVRFTLSSGITLMYDYFYGQWGTFTNIPAISSCLYQGLHTYLNQYGQIFQETPGAYLDDSSPVQMSFATSWMNGAGLQGYQRAYQMMLLGEYYSPHRLVIQVAYDYAPGASTQVIVSPNNDSLNYGESTPYGQELTYGGTLSLEQWRIFFTQQRCQAFQIRVQEFFDASKGAPAGAGLSLSGIALVVGLKKGYRPFRASSSLGSNS